MLIQFFFDGFRGKDFFVYRIARGLKVPFLTLICVLLAGVGSARAGQTAQVEVGFVGVTPRTSQGAPVNFQNVLLNVQSVRINRNTAAGPGNAAWETIPVPSGIGNVPQNADLQIDLNTSQNMPQIFNTANVRPDTYKVAEVLLDPNNPGTLIPDCPLAPPLGFTADGCINYPIQLAAASVISVSNNGGLVEPENGKLAQLFLQVAMTIDQVPTTPGGAYIVTITLNSPPTTPLQVGTITGSVSGQATGASSTVRRLAVTAEAIGTNTPIATAPVQRGKFNLALPAAGGPTAPYGFGTLYDLVLSGGAETYQAARLPPLYPSMSISQDFKPKGNHTLAEITGAISDNCVATKPVVGATLQLLIPPDSVNPAPLTPAAFCIDNPDQCIAVATANTDNAGDFPMPGTVTIPAEFANVPVPPKKGSYAMEISAPGYDSLLVQAIPSSTKTGGTCTASATGTTFDTCDFALNTGYISGTIPITPPNPGQTILVQVFAEDHGTNNIESVLPTPLVVTHSNVGTCLGPPPYSCVSFTLNVPTTDTVPQGFDLFATTIDLYQGVSDPFQGHTTAVVAGVPAPAPPSSTLPRVCDTTTATFPVDQSIDCVGHGSVTGGPSGVQNADLGTSVVLSKDNVQITNTPVQNVTTGSPSNSYAFCVPADTYQLQRLQLPVPAYSAVPSAAPTAVLDTNTVTVTIPPPPLYRSPTPTATATGGPSPTSTPTPVATATPNVKCPTSCTNPDGSCPGICNDVIQSIPQ